MGLSLVPHLATRNRQPELMDQPDLEPDRFIGSLVGLGRVNRFTDSARLLWPDLRAAARRNPGRRLRVLDIACGGGDTVLALWRRGRHAALQVELHGCDVNPLAVWHAQECAKSARADVDFFVLDAVNDEIPDAYDVIMCSLFLHHLPEEQAVAFLRRAAAAAGDRIVIQDLNRSTAGYLLAKYGVLLLLCNEVCRVDGPRSVEGAFTPGEAETLMRNAGLDGGTVERKFPFRFLLRWVKP